MSNENPVAPESYKPAEGPLRKLATWLSAQIETIAAILSPFFAPGPEKEKK